VPKKPELMSDKKTGEHNVDFSDGQTFNLDRRSKSSIKDRIFQAKKASETL